MALVHRLCPCGAKVLIIRRGPVPYGTVTLCLDCRLRVGRNTTELRQNWDAYSGERNLEEPGEIRAD